MSIRYGLMVLCSLLLMTAGCSGGGGGGGGQQAESEAGLDNRPLNTVCLALNRPDAAAAVGLARVFANLAFNNPVGLFQAPGDNVRWFVLEQGGLIKVFQEGAAAADIFVDIRDRIRAGGEQGLLSMAFHPDFPNTPRVFLYYTDTDGNSVLARYDTNPGHGSLNVSSETVLLTVAQPFTNHNGGTLAFGPDGYLYFSLGDGGSGGDPLNNGQNTGTLLGSVLRIDVDGGSPYAIPPDNPFSGNASCDDGGCPEILAWGFRNPWRISFDSETGVLWAGDVGQDRYEEVDILEAGRNYGWKCYEGNHEYDPANCGASNQYTFPVAEYDHQDGDCSITGGFVYRGRNIPGLAGAYVHGDYCSGKIRGLFAQGGGDYETRLLNNSDLLISSFGRDSNGELYVMNHTDGAIYRLTDAPVDRRAVIPERLSETGYVDLEDPASMSPCFIPYDVNVPFWSDGFNKRRFLAIPDDSYIHVEQDGDWTFPNGTVLVKEFGLNGRRVETRLFIRHYDGGWTGYSYEWNDDQTEAFLLETGKTKTVDGQTWLFPSRDQCLQCHTLAAGRSLGLETGQLNRDFTYPSTGRTANQVFTLLAIGMFDGSLASNPAAWDYYPGPGDSSASVESRARAYLQSNCANCHRPGGNGQGRIDLRFQTAFSDMFLCNERPGVDDLGIADARLLAPGDPDRSILSVRMGGLDQSRMPPLASFVVDAEGKKIIDDWIKSLTGCP